MRQLSEMEAKYKINKGVNRPVEFRGLKAQYIYYLAVGLAFLLVLFSILYISGMPVYVCLLLIFGLGASLFFGVYRLNYRFGQFGLMKKAAWRRLPISVRPRSRMIFHLMNTKK